MTIRSDPDYEEKSTDCDPIWLLKKVKKAISGLDDKANNQHMLLHHSVIKVFTMRQWEKESNDGYRDRFESNLRTLKLAGGEHMLCSNQLISAANKHSPTSTEKANDEEKFKARATDDMELVSYKVVIVGIRGRSMMASMPKNFSSSFAFSDVGDCLLAALMSW